MKYILLCIAFFIIQFNVNGQVVSLFGFTASNGDVAVDAQGNVYVVSEGNKVHRFPPEGGVNPILFGSGSALNRASGLSFDPSGDTLYVTCRPFNGQGWISKIAPDGTDEVFVSNLYYPGDISFDDAGNFYVTEYNNNVRKVSPDGVATLYVNSALFNTPIGIAWTPGDTLFVASAHDGNIYKVIPEIGTPAVEWFAHVDGLVQNWACGFMTYSNGSLFITNGDNKIHKITMDGEVSDYAGTGVAGDMNGPFDVAQFQAPNGIGVNSDGSKMFVTEYGLGRVRLIEEGVTGIEDKVDAQLKFSSFPNPFMDETTIRFELPQAEKVNISLYDLQGRLVATLMDEWKEAGQYELKWLSKNLNPGMYIYRMEAGGFLSERKAIVLKTKL